MAKNLYCFKILFLIMFLWLLHPAKAQIVVENITDVSGCNQLSGKATVVVKNAPAFTAQGFVFEYAVDGITQDKNTFENLAVGEHTAQAKLKNTACWFPVEPLTFTIKSNSGITWQYWANLPEARAAIPIKEAPTAVKQLTSFAGPVSLADNYGSRIVGYICPPQSGEYVFYLASDDQSALWLSSDDNPAYKQKIAFVNTYTLAGQYTKYTSQQSAKIALVAGRRYFIEALHWEGIGNDHLSVGWKLPDGQLQQPIAGVHLVPLDTEAGNTAVSSSDYEHPLARQSEGLFAYPNPFTEQTVIDFMLPEAGTVVLEILNTQGKLIKTLYQGNAIQNTGYTYVFDGSQQASGIYICRLSSSYKTIYKKIVLVK